jgi:hypothetical protein
MNTFMEYVSITENNFVSVERINEYLNNETENLEYKN